MRLNIAIGLPLRNQAELTTLLKDLYDPASPSFHQYLTPEQFTERFGPTEQDYQAVIAFAKANGLTVTTLHPNRMIVDVAGAVPNIEKTFHVTMHNYQHPSEARHFYAPDAEPSVDLDVSIASVSGLDNYSLPRPHLKPSATANVASPNSGSGPTGGYMGNDFRTAYAPGVALTGAGQIVGLLQFDGYSASDITYYEGVAGLPNVTLSNVLLDGFNGTPTSTDSQAEVSLDIEMVISMAPGVSKIIVYEAGPTGNWHDILNRMATDNLAKQISCSWYASGKKMDTTADQIFQQMATQGQSFFGASGDDDADVGLISFPGDTPYITQVGGTYLYTNGTGGAWSSETVWNRGNGTGTGGGISTQYAIPTWQQGISMTSNLGSTTMRNVPDVALTADYIYVRTGGADKSYGGTSCAAPLWAGFMALVNQQAVSYGHTTVGFANPAIYTIGKGANYTSDFHDTTSGNNYSTSSPTKFPGATGYDLCTGWGTPNGAALINALSGQPSLQVTPTTSFSATGSIGGPFTPGSIGYTLTNSGTSSLTWTAGATQSWLSFSATSGALAAGGFTTVTASLNSVANALPLGTYSDTITFSNVTAGISQTRSVSLVVLPLAPVITSALTATALQNQSFSYQIVASNSPSSYGASVLPTGLSVDTTTGIISGAPTSTGTFSVTISATNTGGTDTKVLVITVSPPAPVIVNPVTMLYSFSGTDGSSPTGQLVQGSDGSFYGVTSSGGSSGYGTVFKISPSGSLTTLCSFTGTNGSSPMAGLMLGSDGNFYGTTYSGGSSGYGTVFKITPSGSLTTLCSFASTNGSHPEGTLIVGSDGNFYGTTYNGGSSNSGTVYKMTPGGTLTTLCSFTGTNGASLDAGLILASDGNFYGTTVSGGSGRSVGTVFKITSGGSLTTLYSFDYTNGAYPSAGLTLGSDGTFYGTTSGGGTGSVGTIFKITSGGSITSLDSFTYLNGIYPYGESPYGGLLLANDGNFYGTTYYGGTNGYGVIFKMTPGGSLTTLCSFNYTNGACPNAGLAQGSDGNFYGSTAYGGSSNYGTVFKMTSFVVTVPYASAFNYQIAATNSPASYGASGLPAGLSVNTSSGVISGTPTVSGTFNATISATNSGGTGSATLTIIVQAPPLPPAPVISSATSATGTQGVAFNYQITATNSPGSYGASNLPAGLNVNTLTGVISGTPTANGTFNVTITATNAGGTGPATLTLLIQTPYVAWQISIFGANAPASLSGDTVVNNTSGITNLMAYALGLNPFTATVNSLPVMSEISVSGTNYLTLNFVRNATATDITYTVEASTNLTNASGWTAICTFSNGVWSPSTNVIENGKGSLFTVQVQDVQPISSTPQRFLRLKVTH